MLLIQKLRAFPLLDEMTSLITRGLHWWGYDVATKAPLGLFVISKKTVFEITITVPVEKTSLITGGLPGGFLLRGYNASSP